MPFKLTEVISDGEFKEVNDVKWESFLNPVVRLTNLFFPKIGDGPEAHVKRIEESLSRHIHEHRQSPGGASHWIKVVDTDTGEVAGAAIWQIFKKNPYAKPSDEETTFWAAGEDREFATALFEQFLTPRMTYMQKPHLLLDGCFTGPKYRRQGVGKLLMDWGIQIADEMKLECYIDATDMGELLYKKLGFIGPGWIEFQAPEKSQPSARWKELEAEQLPFRFQPQWRPVGGEFKKDTKAPWDAGK